MPASFDLVDIVELLFNAQAGVKYNTGCRKAQTCLHGRTIVSQSMEMVSSSSCGLNTGVRLSIAWLRSSVMPSPEAIS